MERTVIIVMFGIAFMAFIGMVFDYATCKEGHYVREHQAKGDFNHFICDVRRR